MEAMVDWHREGYIDPTVWEKLIRNKVNPAVIPAPSVLQPLPPPPGGESHSALQRLPNPSQGPRHPLELQYGVNYILIRLRGNMYFYRNKGIEILTHIYVHYTQCVENYFIG